MKRFYWLMTNTSLATHPRTYLVETQPKPRKASNAGVTLFNKIIR